MNIPVVLNVLGRLLISYAVAMCIPLAMAFALHEASLPAFAQSVLITGVIGLIMLRSSKVANLKMGIRESFVIVSAAWALTSAFGALPYWLAGTVPTYIDAIFETVSGLTTTGASVISNVEILPQSLLLWRSLTHWLGGMGIIVLFIILLPNTGVAAVHLFNAETPGPTNERVLPRIRDTAAILWKIYTFLTVILILLLWGAGMNFFDAVNHSFATIASGGFSTKNTSIMYYDSVLIEGILIVFMILAGGNFGIYLAAWRKKSFNPFRNSELMTYLLIILGASLLISGSLVWTSGGNPVYAFRAALFQVASIITTTGYASADFDQWPSMTKLILFILMFIGGSAGSTSGGIKVSRIMLLAKSTMAELKRGIHPRAVSAVKLAGKIIEPDVLTRVGIFFFLYVVTFAAASVIIAATGLKPFDAMSAVAATLGNVGPGFGVVGPTTTFAQINLFGKSVLTLCMLLGRLEFFTLLILFRREFWRTRKSW
jgi:trk system potassium uptake protein TrkH